MRILHLCLSCFYIDGYNYQENILPRINHEDGHDVRILASTETYVDNLHLGYVEPREYVTEYGVPIKRLPYVKVGTHFSTIKFRKYPHVYEEIAAFAPDVILSHDLGYWSVLDVIRYKKDHPEVKLYADTHTAYENSGTNWLSLHVLHRMFYRPLIQKGLPYLEKYWYVGVGEKKFSRGVYNVPESLMECYPLGGVLFSPDEYEEKRARRRVERGLEPDELLLVHTGKLGPLKRTKELLQAFADIPELNAKLIIIGSIPEETKSDILPLVNLDSRVEYLGWKSAADLMEYLCAADLYCQPGSGSATLQNAICCGCPVVAFPIDSYVELLDRGQFFWVQTQNDMEDVFRNIAKDSDLLSSKTKGAWSCAREILDYRKLAARLYQ